MSNTTLTQLFANDLLASNSELTELNSLCQPVLDIEFGSLCLDSRFVQADDVFILLKSAVNHDDERSIGYAKKAAEQCRFILSEIDLTQADLSVPHCFVSNIRNVLGDLQRVLLQQHRPVTLPKVLAVTGTNGKTSIATLTAQLLSSQYKVALMGTAGNGIYPDLVPATHTTTDVLAIHKRLYGFAKEQVDVLCLEASSHGLHQHRLQGLPIKVAIYSNLSRDHLDYHHTMAEYAEAKSRLFSRGYFPSLEYAIINIDDDHADVMLALARTADCTVWTYGFKDNVAINKDPKDKDADFCIENYQANMSGVALTLKTPFGVLSLQSPLLGHFNIANLTASIAGALAMGVAFEHIEKSIANIQGVAGRMQAHRANGVTYVVDYAHTPDAIEQVISSLRMHGENEMSKILIVFGCGGDRDVGKRPLMMRAAMQADTLIVTSDNPRSEEPTDIIADMKADLTDAELQQIIIETDRKRAIETAIHSAETGDIVLIAGKGHETYQEIKGIRHDFDDMAVLQSLL